MTLLTEKRAARVVGRANLDFKDVKDPRAYCGKKIVPLSALMRLMVTGFCSGKMVLRSIEAFSGDMPSTIRRLLKIPGSVSDTTL